MNIVVEELKKLKKEKFFSIFILFLIILTPIITVLLYKLSDGGIYVNGNKLSETPFRILNLLFLAVQWMMGVIVSIVLNYFILSKEYIYESWDLLFTKISNRFKIVGSKFFIFYIYYSITSLLSYLLLLFLAKIYLGINLNLEVIPNSLCIILFLNFIAPAFQFLIQLKIPRSVTAISLSIVWILIPISSDFIPLFLQKIIPFFYSGVILSENLISNTVQICIYSAISLVTCILAVILGSKKFYM